MSRNVYDLQEKRFEVEAQSTVAMEHCHQNQLKMLKEVAFVLNDKEMIIVVSETYLIAHQFQKHEKRYLDNMRVVRKSSSAAETTSEETCLGNRDYDSVLSLIDNDVFDSQQCLSMETIMMNTMVASKLSKVGSGYWNSV